MDKTKLDMNRREHQLLVATFATIVEDYGYSPRELFVLLDDAKRQTFHALAEIARESNKDK